MKTRLFTLLALFLCLGVLRSQSIQNFTTIDGAQRNRLEQFFNTQFNSLVPTNDAAYLNSVTNVFGDNTYIVATRSGRNYTLSWTNGPIAASSLTGANTLPFSVEPVGSGTNWNTSVPWLSYAYSAGTWTLNTNSTKIALNIFSDRNASGFTNFSNYAIPLSSVSTNGGSAGQVLTWGNPFPTWTSVGSSVTNLTTNFPWLQFNNASGAWTLSTNSTLIALGLYSDENLANGTNANASTVFSSGRVPFGNSPLGIGTNFIGNVPWETVSTSAGVVSINTNSTRIALNVFSDLNAAGFTNAPPATLFAAGNIPFANVPIGSLTNLTTTAPWLQTSNASGTWTVGTNSTRIALNIFSDLNAAGFTNAPAATLFDGGKIPYVNMALGTITNNWGIGFTLNGGFITQNGGSNTNTFFASENDFGPVASVWAPNYLHDVHLIGTNGVTLLLEAAPGNCTIEMLSTGNTIRAWNFLQFSPSVIGGSAPAVAQWAVSGNTNSSSLLMSFTAIDASGTSQGIRFNPTAGITNTLSTTVQGLFTVTNGENITGGNLGIGTTSPSFFSHIVDPNDDINGYFVDSYASTPNNGAGFTARRSLGGSVGSPIAPTNDVTLAFMGGRGWNGSIFTPKNSAAIAMRASEPWNSGSNGSYIVFGTTTTGTSNRVDRFRIENDGTLNALAHALTNIVASTDKTSAQQKVLLTNGVLGADQPAGTGYTNLVSLASTLTNCSISLNGQVCLRSLITPGLVGLRIISVNGTTTNVISEDNENVGNGANNTFAFNIQGFDQPTTQTNTYILQAKESTATGSYTSTNSNAGATTFTTTNATQMTLIQIP